MRSAIHGLAIATLSVIVPACAMDPDTTEEPASLEAGSALWAAPDADDAAPAALPAGWTSASAEDASDPAVIITSTSGAVASGTSDAVANATSCPAGYVCLFQNSNRGGYGYGVRSGYGTRNLLSVRCPSCTNGIHGNDGTFNDQMTSWENRSGRRYCWWFDVGPGGERHPMNNGLRVNVLARENDQASALGPC